MKYIKYLREDGVKMMFLAYIETDEIIKLIDGNLGMSKYMKDHFKKEFKDNPDYSYVPESSKLIPFDEKLYGSKWDEKD